MSGVAELKMSGVAELKMSGIEEYYNVILYEMTITVFNTSTGPTMS